MALDALLAKLEGRAVTPVTADGTPGVTPKPAPMLACTPVTSVTAENDDAAGKATSKPLCDPSGGLRRERVIAMFGKYPALRYAVLADNLDTDPVLATIGIRDMATFDLAIPKAKFDALVLIDLIGRHGGATVH